MLREEPLRALGALIFPASVGIGRDLAYRLVPLDSVFSNEAALALAMGASDEPFVYNVLMT